MGLGRACHSMDVALRWMTAKRLRLRPCSDAESRSANRRAKAFAFGLPEVPPSLRPALHDKCDRCHINLRPMRLRMPGNAHKSLDGCNLCNLQNPGASFDRALPFQQSRQAARDGNGHTRDLLQDDRWIPIDRRAHRPGPGPRCIDRVSRGDSPWPPKAD